MCQDPNQRLTRLCHHRWLIPVLAAMDDAGGHARLAVLTNQLGGSRGSMRAAVGAAIEAGYIEKNPGYGHPLRPEFRLTESGRAMAAACRGYVRAFGSVEEAGCAFRKWTLPLLVALALGNERFSELASAMPDISPRALTQALRLLTVTGLLQRQVVEGYPPHTRYALTPRGERAAQAARGVAKVL